MVEDPGVLTHEEIEELFGPWDAYGVDRVVEIMSGLTRPWWIAGGWAIELYLGGPQRREHDDVDVLVLRDNASAVQRDLAEWDLHLASREDGVRPWEPGVAVPIDVGDIRLPLADIGKRTVGGIPYLRPEIQLLHKATGSLGIREKDEADFHAVLPVLDADARQWLGEALRRVRADHPWLNSL